MNKADPNGHTFASAVHDFFGGIGHAISSAAEGFGRAFSGLFGRGSLGAKSFDIPTMKATYSQLVTPFPGAPIPVPPVAVPGSPENKGFVKGVYSLLEKLGISTKDEDDKSLEHIYRAVDPLEYNSIVKTGKFSVASGQNYMKQFGKSLAETMIFANHPLNIDKSAIIGVTISKADLSRLADESHVDRSIFKSGTVTIHGDDLDDFNNSILGIWDATP